MSGLLIVVKNTCLQFFFLFGAVGAAALALTFLSRWTSNVFRQFAWPEIGTYLFGWIGVPVHEFSHAVFCALFLHEIQKITWFDPKGKGGAYGSVTHAYQPWNLYHRIGHFFIGLGPVLLAPVILALIAFVLVPAARGALFQPVTDLTWWKAFLPVAHVSTLKTPGFWVFAYLAICVSSQVELSKEDLKQVMVGIPPILFVLAVINLGAWAFDFTWHSRVVSVGTTIAMWSSGLYVFAATVAAINLVVCFLVLGTLNKLWGREFVNPFRS